MESRNIVINGQFTNRRMTGQERFAYELVSYLDELAQSSHIEFTLVVPKDAWNVPSLRNIPVVRYGKAKGSLWEQTYFTFYMMTHKGVSLNLCSIMPVFKPGIVCIHDIAYKLFPEFNTTTYSRISRVWHLCQYWAAKHFSPLILTVSDFSKRQMADIYKIEPDRIAVLGNGWDQFEKIESDESYGTEHPELFEKPYFFSLGSLAPNKNISWILEVARKHPQYNFLIGGNASLKAYGTDYKEQDYQNVKFVGYISDGAVKYLMGHCKAFLFPSFFEGFGIPPLEALSTGAKIVVSNAACLPEIFGDSAYYIDPHDTNVDLDSLLAQPFGDGKEILERNRFNRFAKLLVNTLEDYFEKTNK